MTTFVFLLEEPSAEEMLKGVLPKILPVDVQVRYIVFDGVNSHCKCTTGRLREDFKGSPVVEALSRSVV